jgi:hypothetical protein
MSNWCDCKLTITGPSRRAVLHVLAGAFTDEETGEQVPMVFSMEALQKKVVELGIPIPTLAERSPECPMGSIYIYNQHQEATGDSDVLYFQSQWVEPVEAITCLSIMFPQNTFLLDAWSDDLGHWSGEEEYTGVYNARVCRASFKNGVETKFPLGEDGRRISAPVTSKETGITSFMIAR